MSPACNFVADGRCLPAFLWQKTTYDAGIIKVAGCMNSDVAIQIGDGLLPEIMLHTANECVRHHDSEDGYRNRQ